MKDFLFSMSIGCAVGGAILAAFYAGERFYEWLQDKLEEPDEKKNP